MTDRHAGYIVTLDKNIREDDAEAILNAIRMIKHVISVQPVVADVPLSMARAQVRSELQTKLWVALKD